ncbi:hypothetical protein [Streptomyces sp. NPDC050704]
MPPLYRDWLISRGQELEDAWLNQRLTDIVLNRGKSLPVEELLAARQP